MLQVSIRQHFHVLTVPQELFVSTFKTETYKCVMYLFHAGECADRPGGSSGREDPGPGLVFGRAQGETQRHRGDAAAGVCLFHI